MYHFTNLFNAIHSLLVSRVLSFLKLSSYVCVYIYAPVKKSSRCLLIHIREFSLLSHKSFSRVIWTTTRMLLIPPIPITPTYYSCSSCSSCLVFFSRYQEREGRLYYTTEMCQSESRTGFRYILKIARGKCNTFSHFSSTDVLRWKLIFYFRLDVWCGDICLLIN